MNVQPCSSSPCRSRHLDVCRCRSLLGTERRRISQPVYRHGRGQRYRRRWARFGAEQREWRHRLELGRGHNLRQRHKLELSRLDAHHSLQELRSAELLTPGRERAGIELDHRPLYGQPVQCLRGVLVRLFPGRLGLRWSVLGFGWHDLPNAFFGVCGVRATGLFQFLPTLTGRPSAISSGRSWVVAPSSEADRRELA